MECVGRNKRSRDTERESHSSDCESAKRNRSKRRISSGRITTPLTRVGGSVTTKLQLSFDSRLGPFIYAGARIRNERGGKIHVKLLDASTGEVVKNGRESCAKLNLIVLGGGFNKDDGDSWTRKDFTDNVVKERDGKRPLLIGDTKVKLIEGVGQLGEVWFSDNSSWTKRKKFELAAHNDSICNGANRIREAITEPFAVKDERGEAYKKHFPPKCKDPVWRLMGIRKEGEFHRRLRKAEIHTVEAVRQLVARDSEKLREILGGMGGKRWKVLIDHAKMCEPNGKRYIYSPKDGNGMNVIFNNLADVIGVSVGGGSYIPFKNLDEEQKLSVTKLAYENWDSLQEMPNSGNQYPVIAPQQFFYSNANQIGSTGIQAMPIHNGALLGNENNEIVIEAPNSGNIYPTAHHQFPDFKEDQIGSTSMPILEGQALCGWGEVLPNYDVEGVIEMSNPGDLYFTARQQFTNIYGNQIESTSVPVTAQEQTTDCNGNPIELTSALVTVQELTTDRNGNQLESTSVPVTAQEQTTDCHGNQIEPTSVPVTVQELTTDWNGNQIESPSVPVTTQEQTTDCNGILLDCNTWDSLNIENAWTSDGMLLGYNWDSPNIENASNSEGMLLESLWIFEEPYREPFPKKARLSWLKVKAVLKWGTFKKNRVAGKRAEQSERLQAPNYQACL